MAYKTIQVGQFEYRFRWSLFILLIILLSLGIFLGLWQMERAAEKKSIENMREQQAEQSQISLRASDRDTALMLYRDVEINGAFVAEKQFLLDNQKYKSRPGYHVFTPMRISSSRTHVLVARGWIKQGDDRRFIPSLPLSAGETTIQGRVEKVPGIGFKAGLPGESGRLWPKRLIYIELDWIAKETGLSFLPYVVYQTNDEDNGLVRDWQHKFQAKKRMTPEKHMGYALQWFSLAILVMVMYFILSFKKSGREASSGERS